MAELQHQTFSLVSHVAHMLPPQTNVLFCGHSIGGLMASQLLQLCLADEVLAAKLQRRVWCISFGKPWGFGSP